MKTSNDDIVRRFADLFEGRRSAYGHGDGYCVREPPDFFAHLRGDRDVGVYPLVHRPFTRIPDHEYVGGTWWVKWGCVDLDVKCEGKRRWDYETIQEGLTAASDLVESLRLLGIKGWIERTKNGGYHVWVFAETWVDAASMRHALLTACQVAGVPPTEVNPKSVGFDSPDLLGNFVRLPFPGVLGRKCGLSRVVVDVLGETIGFYPFIDGAEQNRVAATTLEQAAALFKVPEQRGIVEVGDLPPLDKAITDRLSGLTWTVYNEGPDRAIVDRSAWLYRLACLCRDDGLEPEEAAAVVSAADEKWTRKFTDRRDGELRLMETVRRAYR